MSSLGRKLRCASFAPHSFNVIPKGYTMSLFQKLWRKILIKFVFEDPEKCEHEWEVYATAHNQGCLELQCTKCALVGSVNNPTKEEWNKAFGAHEKPYKWEENERVELGKYQLL